MDIQISRDAFVSVCRQEEWVVLRVADGSGAQATVSLDPVKAFDIARLLKGAGVSAVHHTPARINSEDTQSRIADVECPSCKGYRDTCRLCGGTGAVTEKVAADWPPAG